MQHGVNGRFMDQSTSVREAAVELVGKFILIRPELTSQYYDMLSVRILVSCVMVQHFYCVQGQSVSEVYLSNALDVLCRIPASVYESV